MPPSEDSITLAIRIEPRTLGLNAALFSALFLGLAPIFGKQAISFGLPPLAVVAFRTFFAALLLLAVVALFWRKYLYIYPAGFYGCLLAGTINGLGSLFYYSGLGRIDAGVAQFLFSLYPLFVAFWLLLDRQPPSRLTWLRLLLAIPAVYLLVQANGDSQDWIGVLYMLLAAALYALHLPINQRVLYDIPAPTVTLYTLLAMSAIVLPTYLLSGSLGIFPEAPTLWWPVIALTLVTFFSRLTLFTGVKHLGGMQTALLGLGELLITVLLAHWWLGEVFSPAQILGGLLLGLSLLMVGLEKPVPPKERRGGWFSWLTPPTSLPPADLG